MGKFIFDGDTLSILGESSAVVGGVFQFTTIELYNEWLQWTLIGDNLKYLPAFRTSGGDPIGGGISVGLYLFMRNDLGWRGHPPFVGDVAVVIDGNLYPQDTGLPWFTPWAGVTTVIQMQNSSLTQVATVATGSGVTAQDKTDIINGTWSKALEGLTAEEMMRVILAALAGKRSGLGTATENYYAVDGVTPRITLTPTDAAGNGTPLINGAA